MKATEIKLQWKEKGRFIKILDHTLFLIDEGDKSKPVLLVLHGYPSSSLDYIHVLPILTKYFRVVIHDHLGFGFSDKPLDYSYSLMDQADYAEALWKHLGIETAHLLAHDYGTSVATELLARRAEDLLGIQLESLTLTNGSVHIEMADLRLIQKALRHSFLGPIVAKLGSQFIYVHQMKRLWFDKSKVDVEELKALWLIGSAGNGKKVLPKITQYLKERYQYWDRWIGALKSLDLPTHVVWAEEDPVSILKIGETLAEEIPNAKFTKMPNTGHYPMLENPELFAQNTLMFIKY